MLRVGVLDGLPRLVALGLAIWMVVAGWNLRQWTFKESAPVRFRGDITNGLHQGMRVLRHAGELGPWAAEIKKGERMPLESVLRAWVLTYDKVFIAGSERGYSLDYTPLRLLVMSLWAREVAIEYGHTGDYRDEMTGPLMMFNAGMGLAAAVGMFFLVRYWRRAAGVRLRLKESYGTWKGSWGDFWGRHGAWMLGLVAGSLVWFNPALLIDAHAFPQWDVWLVPFFIWAWYAGSRGWWVTAGVLLVLGAMFKGQVLLVAPVLLAWPALRGEVGGILRLGVGLVLGMVMVVWPWLMQGREGWMWMGVSAGAFAVLALGRWLLVGGMRGGKGKEQQGKWGRIARWAGVVVLAEICVGVVVMWVLRGGGVATWFGWTVAGLGVVGALCILLRGWRGAGYVMIGVVAMGVLMSGFRYGGSWSWFAVGFEFPTDHYQALACGPTANLPAILAANGWGLKEPFWTPWWGGEAWNLQKLLRAAYFALLVPVMWGLIWHTKRRSVKVLLCMAGPWVVMFALVPQMHERYLMWGAVMTAAGVGVGLGAGLLHVVVTVFAFACIGCQIMNQNPGWWPQAHRLMSSMIPHGGWAVLLLGLIYVYLCFATERPIRKEVTPAEK